MIDIQPKSNKIEKFIYQIFCSFFSFVQSGITFKFSCIFASFQSNVTPGRHLVPNPFDPRISGSPLPVPLDKWSPIKMIPLDKRSPSNLVPKNLVPLDKWSPPNLVPVFLNPHSLSPWTDLDNLNILKPWKGLVFPFFRGARIMNHFPFELLIVISKKDVQALLL